MPEHGLVDATVGLAVDEAAQQAGEVGLRIDAVPLAGLDQRGLGGLARPAIVARDRKCILATEANLEVILPISGLR